MNKLITFVLLSAAFAPSLRAQVLLLDAKTRDLLHESLSGERAKDHVIQITRHHRIQGSRGYRDAANYVLGELRKAGFDEKAARVESFVSDGKTEYETWQSPSGWDIESAELRMTQPSEERIVGYPEIAMSVITYSNSGDVTAELVDVGAGTSDSDYAGKDVKGKFALATGYGGAVHRLAVLKYGAAAVVCYLADERSKLYPDMLQYTGMWPKTNELAKTTFGFNLTNRQGEKLKSLVASGKKVVLHGSVKGTGLEPFFMDVVIADIVGSEKPDEWLVFSAHLDHPKESANDNASGSGATLDMARALKELIDSGRLPRPKRSLRFMWVPEWNGTMAYIAKHNEMTGPALAGKFLANLNMDMVGENEELLHSKLILTRTPDSCPSVLNDVVENMAQMVDALDVRTPRGSLSCFNWRMTPYSGGSDHMMFIDRKIPAIMFGHEPDYTHHTSEDTPDKVDPVELERCELIAASSFWFLANLDAQGVRDVARLAFANGLERMAAALRAALNRVDAAKPSDRPRAIAEAYNALVRSPNLESGVLSSLSDFTSDKGALAEVNGLAVVSRKTASELDGLFLNRENPQKVNLEVDARVPKRLTRGPLDFGLPESRLPDDRRAWYAEHAAQLNGDVRFELANFIDGTRSISDIRNELSAEFSPIPLDVVAHYIEDLAFIKVVELR